MAIRRGGFNNVQIQSHTYVVAGKEVAASRETTPVIKSPCISTQWVANSNSALLGKRDVGKSIPS